MPPKQMLGYYGAHSRMVEINNTFSHPPTVQLLDTWVAQVSAKFRFALNAPQEITNDKRLKGAEADDELEMPFVSTAATTRSYRLGQR